MSSQLLNYVKWVTFDIKLHVVRTQPRNSIKRWYTDVLFAQSSSKPKRKQTCHNWVKFILFDITDLVCDQLKEYNKLINCNHRYIHVYQSEFSCWGFVFSSSPPSISSSPERLSLSVSAASEFTHGSNWYGAIVNLWPPCSSSKLLDFRHDKAIFLKVNYNFRPCKLFYTPGRRAKIKLLWRFDVTWQCADWLLSRQSPSKMADF